MSSSALYIAASVLAVIITIGFAMKEGTAPLEPKRQRGTVGYVFDGDTVRLREGQGTVIRLWGVDAPERDENGFQRAKIALEGIAENQPITYIVMDTDRYGRTVARVFLKNGDEINRLMIESGTVTEYMRYSKGFYSSQR